MTTEWTSSLYNPHDLKARIEWKGSFDQQQGLPSRNDSYKANFDDYNYGSLVTFKTELEREMELGRDYLYPPMESGECLLRQEHALKAKEGDIVFLKVAAGNLFSQIIRDYNIKAREASEPIISHKD